MDYVTIDFEASCLPRHGRSFPIEVGIAGPEGARAWLISPDPAWSNWDWTEEAQGLHGIDRALLASEGRPVATIFTELVQAIGGRRVFADSSLDAYWWDVLARSAGDRSPCPVEHAALLLGEFGVTSNAVLAAQHRADALSIGRHRAADDALWLRHVLAALRPDADRSAANAFDTARYPLAA